jgi:hypothetical protein
MKTHERSSTNTPLLTPQQFRRSAKRPNLLFLIPLLAIGFCYFYLPINTMDGDKVTRLSVVKGIFKQSDPGFVDGGYDLLGDSFGLIDQEGDRWGKFQRYVSLSHFHRSSATPEGGDE